MKANRWRWIRGWVPALWRLRRRICVPVVYDLDKTSARLGTLELHRIRGGPGGLIANPAMTVTPNPVFAQAIEDAYTWAKARDGFPRQTNRPWTVTWCLRGSDGSSDLGKVGGGSLGAAFGVALGCLFGLSKPGRRRLDPDAFISAQFNSNGSLGTVSQLHTKVPALNRPHTRLLVANVDKIIACNARQGELPGIIGGLKAADAMSFAAAPRPRSVPVLATSIIITIGLLIWAVVQQNNAADARTAHLVQQLSAVSRQKLAAEPAAAALAAAAAATLSASDPAAGTSLLQAATIDSRYDGVLAEKATTVAVSPDGSLLATGGEQGSITLTRPDRTAPPRSASVGGRPIAAMAFSRDGKTLFTGDSQGQLVRWDIATLATSVLRPPSPYSDGDVLQLAVSMDGALLAVLNRQQWIQVFVTATGAPLSTAKATPTVTSMVFTNSSTLLVGVIAQRATDQIFAYNALAMTEPPRVVLHTTAGALVRGITALAISGDGHTMVSGDITGQITLWDTETLTPGGKFKAKEAVLGLNPDEHAETALITTAQGLGISTVIDRDTTTAKTQMWNLTRGEASSAPFGGTFRTATVAADDALRVAVIRGTTGSATLWSKLDGDRLRQDGLVSDIVSDPLDPGVVLTVGTEGRIDVIDVAADRVLRSLPTAGHDGVLGLAVSRSGRLLATAQSDGTVLIRDRDGAIVHELHTSGKAVYRVAFSPAGDYLASGGGDGIVRLWDASTGKQVRQWTTGTTNIQQILFSPSGQRVYVAESGSTGLTIRNQLWWAATDADELHDVQDVRYPARGMTVLADGHVLVGDADGSLRITDDRLLPVARPVPFRHNSNLLAIAYSSGADRVVTASGDNTSAVLKADDLTPMLQFPATDPAPQNDAGGTGVYSAAITGNGRYAVLGGHTGRIQVVPLATDLLINRACHLAGRHATPADLNLSTEDMEDVEVPC